MGRKQGAPHRAAATQDIPRSAPLLPPLVFLILAFLLYGNTLFNGFVNDDKPLVAENRLIRDPYGVARIFTSGYWTTNDHSVPELYRPLTIFSFSLNYLVVGLSPSGYHLINIVLHAMVCWLVFRLALLLGRSPATAWAAGLLFAVHPLHTEAVTPVVGRSELLAAGFSLGALLLHRRRRNNPGIPWRASILTALCYLAAVFSKESAFTLPALLLLTDIAFPEEESSGGRIVPWKPYLLYNLAALFYLGIRITVLGAVATSDARALDNPLLSMGRGTALGTALVTLGKYAWLLVWPWRLSADYSGGEIPPASGPGDPRLLASLVFLGLALGFAFLGWRRRRLASYSSFFLFVAILPVSNLLFFIGTIFGERLVYFPSVGFCLLLGTAWSALRRRQAPLAAFLLALSLLACAARTATRNRIWKDDASFAIATARDAPNSPKAQFNLGVFLEEHSNPRGAEVAYARAAQLAPEWADTHFNRAGVLARTGRLAEAIDAYRRALALRPEDPRVILNLGHALYQARRHQEAIDLYRDRLSRRGDSAEMLNGLGANLLAQGQFSQALEAYSKAVSLAPANSLFRLNLAQAQEAVGQEAAAAATYRAILRTAPDTLPALRNLGILLARRGESSEASQLLRRARSLAPGGLDPEAQAILQSLP